MTEKLVETLLVDNVELPIDEVDDDDTIEGIVWNVLDNRLTKVKLEDLSVLDSRESEDIGIVDNACERVTEVLVVSAEVVSSVITVELRSWIASVCISLVAVVNS
eukprot:NODE_920_length_3091_cov_0.248997.p3 type:complete len:105 gc:universal NODE_920_length_3091_cov_0.248997:2421-2107(-)